MALVILYEMNSTLPSLTYMQGFFSFSLFGGTGSRVLVLASLEFTM